MRADKVKHQEDDDKMKKSRSVALALAVTFLPVTANAQLTIDMSSIRCDQYLAMPPEQSRDFSAWMSGWFSYQTRRTFVDLAAHQQNIAKLIAWCQVRPQEKVMSGLQSVIPAQ
jgi:hypothetical protein